jgi:steroid 5-alpha reductase family enzyme
VITFMMIPMRNWNYRMDRNTGIFSVAILASSALLLTSGRPFFDGLLIATAAFSLVWLCSVVIKNASIVDVFWGIGFIVIGCYYRATVPETPTFRGGLACFLVTVWGLRLALHIGIRNLGAGEDFRYRRWRDRAGSHFWWISFFKVFLLQAIVLWIVSSPLLLAQLTSRAASLGVLDLVGIGLWMTGFLFEAIADWQLARFKRDAANRGRVLRTGLWSLSRHPNYFGEALLWWGFGLLALPTGGLLALIGPAMITFLLIQVSGVAMLDAALKERHPEYAEYIRSTPAFLPLGSRRGGPQRKAAGGASDSQRH